MAATKKTAPKNPPTRMLPPEVDIEAIAARVTDVTNEIMSRVIGRRTALEREIEQLKAVADTCRRSIDQSIASQNQIEGRVREAVRTAENLPKRLMYELDEIQKKVHDWAAGGDAKVVKMIGKMVRVKGGQRAMVASGLDDDGMMLCVYEKENGIVTVAVPPLSLETIPSSQQPTRA